MSAIRNSSSRSQARKARSSPYSRLVDGAIGRVNSFVGWLYNIGNQPDKSFSPTHLDEAPSTLPENPIPNGQGEPQSELTIGPAIESVNRSHSQDPPLSQHPSSKSSESGIEPTTFTFQFTAPGIEPVSFPSAHMNPHEVTPASRRKLDKNPNGSYRWEGAGSARHPRARNRYASPAFGVSPTKSERLLMRDSTNTGETHPADGKRRKVFEESLTKSDSSKHPSSVPFPHVASPVTPRTSGMNGASAKSNALSSPSRLRIPAKQTTPTVPSPLRQAWSDASSTPSREETQASTARTVIQTQTASFMAELIKETTPPKKPDLSNPYQVASPMGKVGPPRRNTRRPRVTGQPPPPAKDQIFDKQTAKANERNKEISKEISPQAIIEATLPKGSKRSRPPSSLERHTPESASQSPPAQRKPPIVIETTKITYVVEEPEEDEDKTRRATKRTKSSANGNQLPPPIERTVSTPLPNSDVVVEEIDVDMTNAETEKERTKESPKTSSQVNVNASAPILNTSSPSSRSSFTSSKLSSIPKEPSKLRFSFQAEAPDASTVPPASVTISTQPAPPVSNKDFKFLPPSSNFNFTFKPDLKNTLKKENSDIEATKETVRAMPPSSLPVFAFEITATSILPDLAEHLHVQNEVKSLPKATLPTFDFGSSKSLPFSFEYDPFKVKAPGSYPGSSKASPPKVNKPAVVRPISSLSLAPSVSAPVLGFDFAAAGMKVPVTAKDSRICSACGLSSPASAPKCVVCDEPFLTNGHTTTPPPDFTSAPPVPPKTGFNWKAAGMRPPSAAKGTWKCLVCGLDSPEVNIECTVCGAVKP